jgi:hypothetical protein
LNLPPCFPVPGSRFRRIARWDLTDEAGGASTRCADPVHGICPPPRSRTLSGRIRKSPSLRAIRRRLEAERYRVRPEMQSAQCSVEIPAPAKIWPSPICNILRATTLGALKENDNRKKAPLADLDRTSEFDPKTMCRQKLRNEFPEAGSPLYLAILIKR